MKNASKKLNVFGAMIVLAIMMMVCNPTICKANPSYVTLESKEEFLQLWEETPFMGSFLGIAGIYEDMMDAYEIYRGWNFTPWHEDSLIKACVGKSYWDFNAHKLVCGYAGKGESTASADMEWAEVWESSLADEETFDAFLFTDGSAVIHEVYWGLHWFAKCHNPAGLMSFEESLRMGNPVGVFMIGLPDGTLLSHSDRWPPIVEMTECDGESVVWCSEYVYGWGDICRVDKNSAYSYDILDPSQSTIVENGMVIISDYFGGDGGYDVGIYFLSETGETVEVDRWVYEDFDSEHEYRYDDLLLLNNGKVRINKYEYTKNIDKDGYFTGYDKRVIETWLINPDGTVGSVITHQ